MKCLDYRVICGSFNLLVYFDHVKLFYVLNTGIIIDFKALETARFYDLFFSV